MEVSLQTTELVSAADCIFRPSFLSGRLWVTASSRLKCQPPCRRGRGGTKGCMIDCPVDVTWAGLQHCSCTAAWDCGYFWRARRWGDVGMMAWSKRKEREIYGLMVIECRSEERSWWSVMDPGSSFSCDDLWAADEEPVRTDKSSVLKLLQENNKLKFTQRILEMNYRC